MEFSKSKRFYAYPLSTEVRLIEKSNTKTYTKLSTSKDYIYICKINAERQFWDLVY